MEVHTSDWTIESNVRCTSFAMPFASPHTYTYAPSDINLHKSLACNKINHRKLGCKVHFELEIIIHHWWLQQDSVRTLFAPSQACSIWTKITFLYYIHICKQNTVKKPLHTFSSILFWTYSFVVPSLEKATTNSMTPLLTKSVSSSSYMKSCNTKTSH